MISVLFSGGIDSWACLHWALAKFGRENVRPVYYDFGQQYAKKEINAARIMLASVDLRDLHIDYSLKLHENQLTGHVPMRNLIFITSEASSWESEGIVFGMLRGEASEDKNPKFIKNLQRLLNSQFVASPYAEQRNYQIYTPLSKMTKAQVVKWLYDCANPQAYLQIQNTVGCYALDAPCGECLGCLNRWVAFELNGLEFNTNGHGFARHPFFALTEHIKGKKKLAIDDTKLSILDIWRRRHKYYETLKALNKYSRRTFYMNYFDYYKRS